MNTIRPAKFKLPIGFEGKLKSTNTHNMPKGTKFIIKEYTTGYFHYVVEFKVKTPSKMIQDLNATGPYITHDEIEFGKNGELFYAKS